MSHLLFDCSLACVCLVGQANPHPEGNAGISQASVAAFGSAAFKEPLQELRQRTCIVSLFGITRAPLGSLLGTNGPLINGSSIHQCTSNRSL